MNHIINWVIQINGTFLFHINHINHINKHGNLDFIHSFRNFLWIFELHLVLKLTVFIKCVSSVGNGPWIWGHIRKVKINLSCTDANKTMPWTRTSLLQRTDRLLCANHDPWVGKLDSAREKSTREPPHTREPRPPIPNRAAFIDFFKS